MAVVRKDDKGTVLRLTVKDENGDAIDVSSATTKEIYLRKPDGELKTVTAVNTEVP